jgi:phage terminase small subunit
VIDMTTKIDPATGLQKLTHKQKAFAEHFAKHGGFEASALAAGYNAKNAYASGVLCYNTPHVKAYIKTLKHAHLIELGYTEEDIIAEHAKIAFSDIGKAVSFSGNEAYAKASDKIDTALVKKITFDKEGALTGIEMYDKQKSLDSLIKTMGLGSESLKVGGLDGGAIQIDTAAELIKKFDKKFGTTPADFDEGTEE